MGSKRGGVKFFTLHFIVALGETSRLLWEVSEFKGFIKSQELFFEIAPKVL
jgi:hypothetical protein